jgi:hypothetical protein
MPRGGAVHRRAGLLIALLVAVACAEQPTEPSKTETPFQAVLGPPPAPPTALSTGFPAANGAPSLQELGFYEAPTIAKVTVSGLLNYSNDNGAGSGYLPGSGSIDAQGIYVPQGNYCALQLSVRVTGFGRIGGYDGTSCPHIQQVGSITNYAVVSGQIIAQRLVGPPGACFFGGNPCTTITGEQQVEIVPEAADLALTSLKTQVGPGGLILIVANPSPAFLHGIAVPWSLREWRWEGSGPTVGGGQTKVCSSVPTANSCYVTMYQSGNVVLEAVVNGTVKTQRMWLRVTGGDSVPPAPKDSVPPDSIPPSDTTGGGGAGGCGTAPSHTGPMRACGPPPDTIVVSVSTSSPFVVPIVDVGPFNANTQVATFGGTGVRVRRSDVVTVTVTAQMLRSRDPVGGLSIHLRSAPVAGSGGHIHSVAERPKGTFMGSDDDESSPRDGHRGEMVLTTDESGTAAIRYRSSGIGGQEWITATPEGSSAPAAADSVMLKVQYPGLVAMARDGGILYQFKEQNPDVAPSQRHGNNNNWVRPTFRDSLLVVFGDFYQRGGQFTGSTTKEFLITDAGLEFGGLLDAGDHDYQEWNSPHMSHRRGNDIDIRDTESGHVVMSAISYEKLIAACWPNAMLGKMRVRRCDTEPPPDENAPHIHIEGLR